MALPNQLSWSHHTVECVKTLRFTVAYYSETSNYHKHFLDGKVTCICQQCVVESFNKTTVQPVQEDIFYLAGK